MSGRGERAGVTKSSHWSVHASASAIQAECVDEMLRKMKTCLAQDVLSQLGEKSMSCNLHLNF